MSKPIIEVTGHGTRLNDVCLVCGQNADYEIKLGKWFDYDAYTTTSISLCDDCIRALFESIKSVLYDEDETYV